MRIALVLGLLVALLATETLSRPAVSEVGVQVVTTVDLPTIFSTIAQEVDRILITLKNPNQPFWRDFLKVKALIEKTVNNDLEKVEKDFDKEFQSEEHLEQMTDSETPKVDPKALNPVIGAIQTVGDLAQLLVAVGQQVIPGLIAGVVANTPGGGGMPLAARLEHGQLVKSIIKGLNGGDSGIGGVGADNFTTSVEM